MKKISTYLILFVFAVLFSSCEEIPSEVPNYRNIEGQVQKGPFISGSSVTIYELDENLTPTGMSFNTPIKDNQGTFSLSNIPLDTTFVKLKADGFYYNEIKGKLSDAQISLYALADISNIQKVNVNLLTHLEYERAEFLFHRGSTLAEAKAQAQQEILAIFNIEKDEIRNSEDLNIVKRGEDNGILLAITAIIQGLRTESQMTELLYSIINDIKPDGTLDDLNIGSLLINHAGYLDTTSIASNLKDRYTMYGYPPDIPEFVKFIGNFISNTTFVVSDYPIKYPKEGIWGPNILNLNTTTIIADKSKGDFSLTADIIDGTSLMIRINKLTGALWAYSLSSVVNWQITDYNKAKSFTVIQPGVKNDIRLSFFEGQYLIEYFEMGSAVPSHTKILTAE